MDPFFSELSSLMDDPNLYSLDLDSIQLFPEVELNFQPVQLFPEVKPPQAQLCDPDQFLVPSLPLNQDCVKETSSNSLRPFCLSIKIVFSNCALQMTSQQPIKTLTCRKTVSMQFALIISDREVQVMRERAKPANTQKSTNWAITVGIKWTEYRRSVQKRIFVNQSFFHL